MCTTILLYSQMHNKHRQYAESQNHRILRVGRCMYDFSHYAQKSTAIAVGKYWNTVKIQFACTHCWFCNCHLIISLVWMWEILNWYERISKTSFLVLSLYSHLKILDIFFYPRSFCLFNFCSIFSSMHCANVFHSRENPLMIIISAVL